MSNLFARSAQRWLPVFNADTRPAPPFALLAVTGVDNQGNFTVTRPAADGQTGLLINGPLTLPTGALGQAHATFPAIVAYDDGGDPNLTPQARQSWGPRAPSATDDWDAWKLQPGQPGFRILGGAADGLVNVQAPMTGPALAFVTVTSNTAQIIYLPDSRTVADGVLTSGSTTLTSATANFTSADVNVSVVAGGLPPATWIVSVQSPTSCTLNNNALATVSVNRVTIGAFLGYAAVLANWHNELGLWVDSSQAVWFAGTLGSTLAGQRYGCRQLGADHQGVSIWGIALPLPLEWVTVTSSIAQDIYLPSGQTTQGYAAVIANWDQNSGQWVDSNVAVWFAGTLGQTLKGWRFQCRLAGTDADGISIWTNVSLIPWAWVRVTSLTPQQVNLALERTVSDGILTKGSPNISSSTAQFTAQDVGKPISGPGIVPGTTIQSIQSSSTATLSGSVTMTGSQVKLSIDPGGATLSVYPAVADGFSNATGGFVAGATVWFYEVNGAVPVLNQRYQCRLLDVDANDTAIWATVVPPAASSPVSFFITTRDYVIADVTDNQGAVHPGTRVYPGNSYSTPDNAASGVPPGPLAGLVVQDSFALTFNRVYQVAPYGTATIFGVASTKVFLLDDRAPVTYTPLVQSVNQGQQNLIYEQVMNDDANVPVCINSSTIQFGPVFQGQMATQNFPAASSFVNTAVQFGGLYQCASGTDGLGNIFIAGWNTSVGGVPPSPPPSSSPPTLTNFGSDW